MRTTHARCVAAARMWPHALPACIGDGVSRRPAAVSSVASRWPRSVLLSAGVAPAEQDRSVRLSTGSHHRPRGGVVGERLAGWLRSQSSMVLCRWPTTVAPRLLGRRAARSPGGSMASFGWRAAPRRSLADIATPNPRVFLDIAIGSGEPQRITFEVRREISPSLSCGPLCLQTVCSQHARGVRFEQLFAQTVPKTAGPNCVLGSAV